MARGSAEDAEDVKLALDAAHKARDAWGRTPPAQRAAILNKIAERVDKDTAMLAHVEMIDNGKPIRETLNADVTTGRRSIYMWPPG